MGYRDIDCESYPWLIREMCFAFGSYPQDKMEEFYSCINNKYLGKRKETIVGTK